MRFILGYFVKMLSREGFKSLTIPMLALVLVFLINLMGEVKIWLETEYAGMMDEYKIIAEVSDLTGTVTDEMQIGAAYIDLFREPEALWSLSGYVDEVYLKRGLNVVSVSGAPAALVLTGITHIAADDLLLPETGAAVDFFPGYDESVFKTDERICVVSADVLEAAESGRLNLELESRYTNIYAKTHQLVDGELREIDARPYMTVNAEFTVAGTVSGAGAGLIYCPFSAASGLGEASDGLPYYSERLYATLSDNRALTEFKRTAWWSFSRVAPVYDSRPFAMTIYDSAFFDAIESLRRNMILVDIATPFVHFMSICVGFIASVLLTRRRKPEFALMQSVGIHRRAVFFGALFEQTALCAAGALLGCAIAAAAWGHVSFAQSLIFLFFYMLGALFSAVWAAGTNVLKILQDRE